MVPTGIAPISPFIEQPFASQKSGFHVIRHGTPGSRPRRTRVEPLDQKTLNQLRTLGYVR
jgi:hypothetical protein